MQAGVINRINNQCKVQDKANASNNDDNEMEHLPRASAPTACKKVHKEHCLKSRHKKISGDTYDGKKMGIELMTSQSTGFPKGQVSYSTIIESIGNKTYTLRVKKPNISY